MKIMMIRHFQTPGNLEKRYVGRSDEELLENHELFECAARKRKVFDTLGQPEIVIASPMKRCVKTARLLFPGKEQVLCEKMKECDFGLFEEKNYEELKELPAYQKWLNSRGTLPFPEGESHEAFKKRCIDGFEEMINMLMQEKCQMSAMVVHGGTIMAVLSQFDKEKQEFYNWQVENGGGYLISLDEKTWKQGQKEFREIERL